MKKLLTIEGMSCGHCVMHGKVRARRSTRSSESGSRSDQKSAMVEGEDLTTLRLKHAVTEAGYRVSAIYGRH